MEKFVTSLKIMTKIKEENDVFFSPYNVLNKPITLYKWKLNFVKHKNKK